ncbi:hypothetical protein GGF31_006066 [Allomyces arbusculus]|nr:hypothetical protein GGF31_006066 [Allomyces arbusculus]
MSAATFACTRQQPPLRFGLAFDDGDVEDGPVDNVTKSMLRVSVNMDISDDDDDDEDADAHYSRTTNATPASLSLHVTDLGPASAGDTTGPVASSSMRRSVLTARPFHGVGTIPAARVTAMKRAFASPTSSTTAAAKDTDSPPRKIARRTPAPTLQELRAQQDREDAARALAAQRTLTAPKSWFDQLDEKHQKLHAPHAVVAVGTHGHFVTFAKHRQNAAAVGRYTSSLPTPDPAPVLSRLLSECAISRTPRADKDNERRPRIRAITDLPRHWRFADYAPLIAAEHSRVLIDLLGVLYDPPAGLDDFAAPPVVYALVTKTRLQQWLAHHLAASADRKANAAIAEGRPLRAVAAWLAAHQLDRACATATTHAKSPRLAMLIAASAVDPGMVRAHADAIRAAKPVPSEAETDYLAVLDLLSVGALTRDPTPAARTALVRALSPLSLAESLAVLLAARHDWSIFDAWSTCLDLQVEPGMFANRSNLDTALITALVHFAAPRSTDHAARLVAAATASPDAAVPDLTPAVLVYLGLLALRREDVPAPVPAVGARLLAQYAASLDAAGRWEWAVLAIMLMGVVPAPAAPKAATREAWISELVARNATPSASLTRAERYVVRDLRVTEHNIWLAKALRIEAFLDAKTVVHGGRFVVGAGGAPKVGDRDAALAMFHQCVMHVRDAEGAKQAAWALKERVPDLILGMKWDEVVKAVVSPAFAGDDGQWPPAVPEVSDAAVPPVARVAVAWAHLMRARGSRSDEEVQAWAGQVAEMAREVKARADEKVGVKVFAAIKCIQDQLRRVFKIRTGKGAVTVPEGDAMEM